jgi:Phosphate-selective porin O and P
MKRCAFTALILMACSLISNSASLSAQEIPEQVLFQDTTAQPTPVTTALDQRLKALEQEALLSRPALEDYARRIDSIESSLKTAKEKEEQKKADDAKKEKKWFEKVSFRGYTQVRINEVFEESGSDAAAHYVGDSSIGENQSFLLRRVRLIFYGDVNEHVYVYIQPDFAVNVPGSSDANQFTQLRDAYADLYVDKDKEFRFRVGQSKVPYGWENLQSSQNRLPLDRNDALNSAVRNERDLGVFFYWTPKDAQDLFKEINDLGLKGSGNYGVFGIGAYNGQGGSLREQNDNLHVVSRLTLPFYLNDDQIVEVGLQGYIGKYSVLSSAISPLGVGPDARPLGTVEMGGRDGIHDKRLAASFIYYPQPWGFQSEWTVGRGPSLNDAQTAVVDRALYGGYAMLMYRLELEKQELIPFARWNYYKGGYKTERNAPYSEIKEWEMGMEWQVNKSLEVVGMYTLTDRTNTTSFSSNNTRSYEQFEGSLLRFQVQFNY